MPDKHSEEKAKEKGRDRNNPRNDGEMKKSEKDKPMQKNQ